MFQIWKTGSEVIAKFEKLRNLSFGRENQTWLSWLTKAEHFWSFHMPVHPYYRLKKLTSNRPNQYLRGNYTDSILDKIKIQTFCRVYHHKNFWFSFKSSLRSFFTISISVASCYENKNVTFASLFNFSCFYQYLKPRLNTKWLSPALFFHKIRWYNLDKVLHARHCFYKNKFRFWWNLIVEAKLCA